MQSKSKSPMDVFVDGARKGWALGVNNILPNVIMAFALIHILKLSGILDMISKTFGPIMAPFGLPGEAIVVLVSGWLSMGGGVGVAASLYGAGTLTNTHITILLPGIFLMGAQIQNLGRCLGTAGVQTKYYPHMLVMAIVNAVIAMLIMRLITSGM